MKKISMIVVNYATKGLLEKNITNLLESWEKCEIIFIDNDSPDGSANFVEKEFGDNPKFQLIRTKNNGLSAGYNLGLKKATGDYHLYLGTDAFPTQEALGKIVNYMDQNVDVGIVTAKLYNRDGSIDMDAHRGFPTPWVALTHFSYLDRVFPKSKVFNGYNQAYKDFDSTHEIDACISHFMFVNPIIYKTVGIWDERYFLYGEDIDFCYRVKQAGYKVVYMGDTKVLHYKGASVGRNVSKDIENAMNTDFDYISIRDERLEGNPKDKTEKKKNRTSRWFSVKIAKESTRAMRIFYKKYFMEKYPKPLTFLVLLGIWITEKRKVAQVLLKSYLR